MNDQQKLQMAMALLKDVAEYMCDGEHVEDFFRRYFTLTGEHAILTEEGWMTQEEYENGDPMPILDVVNPPLHAA